MKKIRLNVADLEATEILSREQLKSVFGGSGSGSSDYYYSWDCWCSNSTKGGMGSWTMVAVESSVSVEIAKYCPSPLTGQCTK